MKLPKGEIENLCATGADDPAPLKHVLYDVERRRLVATNSHALVVIEAEPDKGDVTGLVPVEAFKHARQLARRQKVAGMIHIHCRDREVIVEDLTSEEKRVMRRPHGNFPAYEHLIPHVEGKPDATFNPYRFQDLLDALPKAELGSSKTGQSVSFWMGQKVKGSDLNPIVVKCVPEGAVAVLMQTSFMAEAGWHSRLPGELKPVLAGKESAVSKESKPVETVEKSGKTKKPSRKSA